MICALAIAVQTPRVQTRLVRGVTEGLFERFDADLSFDKLSFRPFNKLVIRGVCVRNREPAAECDTLFAADWIVLSFDLKGLMQMRQGKGVHLQKAVVRDGLFNLVIEGERKSNLQRMFGLSPKEEPKRSDKEIFSIDRVELKNMSYGMQNIRPDAIAKREARRGKNDGGIDWNDLLVSEINLKGKELRFSKGIMSGEVVHLEFREKSGFVCKHLGGSTAVGNGKTEIWDLEIDDGDSELKLPHFTMGYKNSREFKYFLEKVSLHAELEGTRISSRTLSHFAPVLGKTDIELVLDGELSGPVSDLRFDNLAVATADKSSSLLLDGRIKGLPDIRKSLFDLRIRQCRSSVTGIDRLLSKVDIKKEVGLGKLLPDTRASLFGSAKGSLDDMDARFYLESGLGDILAELEITNLLSGNEARSFEGTVQAEDLDLGAVSGRKFLGNCSLRSGLCASLDKEKGASLRIDSLMVDKLVLNGYEYHNIAAAGTVAEDRFNGRIISRDPAFNFIFQGVFSLAPKTRNSVYQFYANIGHADLHAMNLDKRESSTASLRVNANFNRTPNGHMLGNINVGDVLLESDGQRYDIGDLSFTSHSLNSRYRINFSSGFAEARYDGTRPVTEFVSALSEHTLRRELPALLKKREEENPGGSYDISFKFTDPSDISAFFKPGLYIDKNTALSLHLGDDGLCEASLKSRRIALKEQYIKEIDFTMDNRNDILSGDLSFKELNAAGIRLENNNLRLYANDGMVGVGLSFENEGPLVTKGELIARGEVTRNAENMLGLDIRLLPSGFYFNSAEWNVMPAGILIDGSNISFDGVELTSGDQDIRINGGIAKDATDTLNIALERFDLGIANPFISKGSLGIEGAVTGEMTVSSSRDGRGITADFLVDSTSLAGTNLGSVFAKSLWNKEFNRFDLSLSNELDSRRSLKLNAGWYPANKRIEAEAELDRQDITWLKSLLKGVFSEIDGSISGKVRAEGTLDNLELSSYGTRIDNSLLKVDYTMVPYIADGAFQIDSRGIHFDDIALKDMQKGKGRLTGSVNWDHFKDIGLDIHIDCDNLEAINRPLKDNDGYYGRVFGSGTVDISGPLKDILIGVDMNTGAQSRFYIPLSNTATAGTTDILKFKEVVEEVQVDPYEEMLARLRSKEAGVRKNKLGVSINAHVNPMVEAFLEINRDNGSVLSGRGRGDISVDFRTGKPISLKGDYTLDEGSFHLNLMNLANRDFTISEGSSVKFNGGVMDTDLDIDAVYTTKTSISSLIGDTTSVNSRRNVNCALKVGGKLREPKVNFAIDIPDLDPSVKARVESALSTEDKVQRQVLALLLTNNFLQDEQGGINNSASGAIYSNAMNLISNQLNNILTKLGIPLDFGLKYQQNDKGNDVFDVAVSTQLFNNRVVINGNIGNRQYKNGNSNSEVAGDIEIEIKLDRSGALRLNLFTHSADQYTNYLDNSQRSGLGLAYQREFNKVSEVFKYMFAGKAKRERLDMEEQQRLQEEGMKTIVIE